MKRIQLIYISIFTLLLSTGCSKFLEEQSQNQVKPSQVQDLISLMSGSGYPYNTTLDQLTEIMSDNVQCNGGQGQLNYEKVVKAGKAPFSWSKDMYEELLLPEGFSNNQINSWEVIYNRIATCNTVLAYIDRVAGDEVNKNNLRGQALTLRGYYYLILVNLYGKPYNAPGIDPKNSPGVPLRLRMEVTDSLYARNSVQEVYTQVEKDFKSGLALMKAYPQENGMFKLSPLGAYALLSRMYLYQEKWAQSIAYADSALAIKSGLTQLSTLQASGGGYYLYNNGFTSNTLGWNTIYDARGVSKEIIWKYNFYTIAAGLGASNDPVLKTSIIPSYNAILKPPYAVSDELYFSYEGRPVSDTGIYLGDLRQRIYIKHSAYVATPVGFNRIGGALAMGGAGIRVAELYLNRAEAKIQLAIQSGNTALLSQALDDINTLRTSRYDPRKPYTPISITNPQELLTFCRDERRREFPFENHRWFDLRRYGMPSITHNYEATAGTSQTFTLTQGDNRYTLPIPKVTLDRNGMLTQNP